jgi:hypothetical protein
MTDSEIHALAQQIANHIPGARYEQPRAGRKKLPWRALINLDAGKALRIEPSRTSSTHVQIMGRGPNGIRLIESPDGTERTLVLSVSGSLPPKKIAKEITNRLLPDYSYCHHIEQARLEKEEAAIKKQIDRLKGMLESFRPIKPIAKFDFVIRSETIFALFTVKSDGVRIDMRGVPYELAEKISELIAANVKPCSPEQ